MGVKSKPKGKDFEAWEIPKRQNGAPWVMRAENQHPGAASAVTAKAPPHDLLTTPRARGRGGAGPALDGGRGGDGRAAPPPGTPTPAAAVVLRTPGGAGRRGPPTRPSRAPAQTPSPARGSHREAAGSGRLTGRGARAKLPPRTVRPAFAAAAGPERA